jgi:hypothetical protein
MAGEDLNYYYLGHLMAAGLVHLSGVAPDVGYNLAVATFFVFSVAAAFGLALALGRSVAAGLWGVALCIVAGTIGSGLELVRDGGPLRSYDWFGASRVIKGTINEFPSFSFTLADLHGHVMAIPFSLLALGFGLQLALAGPPPPPRPQAALELAVAAIAIGTLYAINAWSFPVIAGLVALGALVRMREAGSVRERARTLAWTLAALALAVIARDGFADLAAVAGSGLRDMTRLASGDQIMHRDICLTNRDHLVPELEAYARRVAELAEAIRRLPSPDDAARRPDDPALAALEARFAGLKRARDAWLAGE